MDQTSSQSRLYCRFKPANQTFPKLKKASLRGKTAKEEEEEVEDKGMKQGRKGGSGGSITFIWTMYLWG